MNRVVIQRFNFPALAVIAIISLCISALSISHVRANSDMFPPIGLAKRYIQIDGRGFTINGKRTFICSGSFHYARVPERLWRNRLLKMKRAGFNTVQTYVFWNFQEPQKNVFNWKGRANLSHFLNLVHKMGMYATVRCGPYDCAEWDSGGYPVWLEFIKHLRVRHNDPAFMHAVSAFWQRLMPIVASHQISRGGAVIMVQLENEDSAGWGTDVQTAYYRHLLKIARSAGIVVPTFFSGMHHGFDPAGHKPWNDADRTSPWYTTELWSSPTWYQGYGAMPPDQQMKVNRGIWKIIAFGGAGYNFYMLVGSTNFGMWNDDELAAGYDFSSAIGQAGDLRPIYFQMKRTNYFARSFQNILDDSVNADQSYGTFAAGVRVLARRGPAGTIVFLDNATHLRAVATLGSGLHIKLKPMEIFPIVLDAPISNGFSIVHAESRILGIQRSGQVTTIVIYGHAGGRSHVEFKSRRRPVLHGAFRMVSGGVKAREFSVSSRFGRRPVVSTAIAGSHVLRVITESTRAADRTWFVHSPVGPMVIQGPAYVGRVTGTPTSMRVFCSTPINNSVTSATAWGQGMEPIHLHTLAFMTRQPRAPRLSGWQYRTLTAPAEVAFNDENWVRTRQPMPMGFDGVTTSPWCWYRTVIKVSQAGNYQIVLSHYANTAIAFINGKLATISGDSILASLHPSQNVLAIFTGEYGRNKLYNYYGKINKNLAKGLWGRVYLAQGTSFAIKQWRVIPMGDSLSTDKRQIEGAEHIPGNAAIIKTGTDYFHGRVGYAAYFTTVAGDGMPYAALKFSDVDDNGWVFMNGHLIGAHQGWGMPFTVMTGADWKAHGRNRIAVLVQNTSGGGGVMGTAMLNRCSTLSLLTGWRMKGGLTADDGIRPWRSVSELGHMPLPRLYKAEFNWQPGGQVGWHMVLRADWGQLHRGHIYINGHDLGLYPDHNVPAVGGLYIPSVWLRPGQNQLEMFDIRGQTSRGAKIVVDPVASRLRWMLISRH